MMKKIGLLSILLIFLGPVDLPAFRDHRPAVTSIGNTSPVYSGNRKMRTRLKMPVKYPLHPDRPGKPVHPIYPGHNPGKPGHRPPGEYPPRYWWPTSTTIVREVQPIIVVNNPPPAVPAPPPEPEKVWVPPVMETQTEPGYWDYGVKKRWMGDHWRYEQDFEEKAWVPETQVTVVKQEGYWKFAE